MFCIHSAGGPGAHEVRDHKNRFAGIIVERRDGTARHYYNDSCTKGSQRKFASVNAALNNVARRRSKG